MIDLALVLDDFFFWGSARSLLIALFVSVLCCCCFCCSPRVRLERNFLSRSLCGHLNLVCLIRLVLMEDESSVQVAVVEPSETVEENLNEPADELGTKDDEDKDSGSSSSSSFTSSTFFA